MGDLLYKQKQAKKNEKETSPALAKHQKIVDNADKEYQILQEQDKVLKTNKAEKKKLERYIADQYVKYNLQGIVKDDPLNDNVKEHIMNNHGEKAWNEYSWNVENAEDPNSGINLGKSRLIVNHYSGNSSQNNAQKPSVNDSFEQPPANSQADKEKAVEEATEYKKQEIGLNAQSEVAPPLSIDKPLKKKVKQQDKGNAPLQAPALNPDYIPPKDTEPVETTEDGRIVPPVPEIDGLKKEKTDEEYYYEALRGNVTPAELLSASYSSLGLDERAEEIKNAPGIIANAESSNMNQKVIEDFKVLEEKKFDLERKRDDLEKQYEYNQERYDKIGTELEKSTGTPEARGRIALKRDSYKKSAEQYKEQLEQVNEQLTDIYENPLNTYGEHVENKKYEKELIEKHNLNPKDRNNYLRELKSLEKSGGHSLIRNIAEWTGVRPGENFNIGPFELTDQADYAVAERLYQKEMIKALGDQDMLNEMVRNSLNYDKDTGKLKINSEELKTAHNYLRNQFENQIKDYITDEKTQELIAERLGLYNDDPSMQGNLFDRILLEKDLYDNDYQDEAEVELLIDAYESFDDQLMSFYALTAGRQGEIELNIGNTHFNKEIGESIYREVGNEIPQTAFHGLINNFSGVLDNAVEFATGSKLRNVTGVATDAFNLFQTHALADNERANTLLEATNFGINRNVSDEELHALTVQFILNDPELENLSDNERKQFIKDLDKNVNKTYNIISNSAYTAANLGGSILGGGYKIGGTAANYVTSGKGFTKLLKLAYKNPKIYNKVKSSEWFKNIAHANRQASNVNFRQIGQKNLGKHVKNYGRNNVKGQNRAWSPEEIAAMPVRKRMKLWANAMRGKADFSINNTRLTNMNNIVGTLPEGMLRMAAGSIAHDFMNGEMDFSEMKYNAGNMVQVEIMNQMLGRIVAIPVQKALMRSKMFNKYKSYQGKHAKNIADRYAMLSYAGASIPAGTGQMALEDYLNEHIKYTGTNYLQDGLFGFMFGANDVYSHMQFKKMGKEAAEVYNEITEFQQYVDNQEHFRIVDPSKGETMPDELGDDVTATTMTVIEEPKAVDEKPVERAVIVYTKNKEGIYGLINQNRQKDKDGNDMPLTVADVINNHPLSKQQKDDIANVFGEDADNVKIEKFDDPNASISHYNQAKGIVYINTNDKFSTVGLINNDNVVKILTHEGSHARTTNRMNKDSQHYNEEFHKKVIGLLNEYRNIYESKKEKLAKKLNENEIKDIEYALKNEDELVAMLYRQDPETQKTRNSFKKNLEPSFINQMFNLVGMEKGKINELDKTVGDIITKDDSVIKDEALMDKELTNPEILVTTLNDMTNSKVKLNEEQIASIENAITDMRTADFIETNLPAIAKRLTAQGKEVNETNIHAFVNDLRKNKEKISKSQKSFAKLSRRSLPEEKQHHGDAIPDIELDYVAERLGYNNVDDMYTRSDIHTLPFNEARSLLSGRMTITMPDLNEQQRNKIASNIVRRAENYERVPNKILAYGEDGQPVIKDHPYEPELYQPKDYGLKQTKNNMLSNIDNDIANGMATPELKSMIANIETITLNDMQYFDHRENRNLAPIKLTPGKVPFFDLVKRGHYILPKTELSGRALISLPDGSYPTKYKESLKFLEDSYSYTMQKQMDSDPNGNLTSKYMGIVTGKAPVPFLRTVEDIFNGKSFEESTLGKTPMEKDVYAQAMEGYQEIGDYLREKHLNSQGELEKPVIMNAKARDLDRMKNLHENIKDAKKELNDLLAIKDPDEGLKKEIKQKRKELKELESELDTEVYGLAYQGMLNLILSGLDPNGSMVKPKIKDNMVVPSKASWKYGNHMMSSESNYIPRKEVLRFTMPEIFNEKGEFKQDYLAENGLKVNEDGELGTDIVHLEADFVKEFFNDKIIQKVFGSEEKIDGATLTVNKGLAKFISKSTGYDETSAVKDKYYENSDKGVYIKKDAQFDIEFTDKDPIFGNIINKLQYEVGMVSFDSATKGNGTYKYTEYYDPETGVTFLKDISGRVVDVKDDMPNKQEFIKEQKLKWYKDLFETGKVHEGLKKRLSLNNMSVLKTAHDSRSKRHSNAGSLGLDNSFGFHRGAPLFQEPFRGDKEGGLKAHDIIINDFALGTGAIYADRANKLNALYELVNDYLNKEASPTDDNLPLSKAEQSNHNFKDNINLNNKTPIEGLNERLKNYGYTELILSEDFYEGSNPKGRLNFFKASIEQVKENLQILEDLDFSEFSFLSENDLKRLNDLKSNVKKFRNLNLEISSKRNRTVGKEIEFAELSNKILNEFVDIINPHVKSQLGKSISTDKNILNKQYQKTSQQKEEGFGTGEYDTIESIIDVIPEIIEVAYVTLPDNLGGSYRNEDNGKGKISINKKQDLQTQKESLAHELVHGILELRYKEKLDPNPKIEHRQVGTKYEHYYATYSSYGARLGKRFNTKAEAESYIKKAEFQTVNIRNSELEKELKSIWKTIPKKGIDPELVQYINKGIQELVTYSLTNKEFAMQLNRIPYQGEIESYKGRTIFQVIIDLFSKILPVKGSTYDKVLSVLNKYSENIDIKVAQQKEGGSGTGEYDKTINIYAGTKENADLSNFAIRPFKTNVEFDDGGKQIEFQSVEQGFHYNKAVMADRMDIADKVLKTTDGGSLKALTNRRNMPMSEQKAQEWDNVSKSVMNNLMYDSYANNPEAARKLLATGNAKLTHNGPGKPDRWTKDFPEVIMTVRDMLKEEGLGQNNNLPLKYVNRITPEGEKHKYNKNPLEVAIKQNKVYRGVSMETQYHIDDNGNLIFPAQSNFDEKTKGVSITPYLDTAMNYATRAKDGTSKIVKDKGTIITITDPDIIKSLKTENHEEIYSDKDLVVKKGDYSIEEYSYHPDHSKDKITKQFIKDKLPKYKGLSLFKLAMKNWDNLSRIEEKDHLDTGSNPPIDENNIANRIIIDEFGEHPDLKSNEIVLLGMIAEKIKNDFNGDIEKAAKSFGEDIEINVGAYGTMDIKNALDFMKHENLDDLINRLEKYTSDEKREGSGQNNNLPKTEAFDIDISKTGYTPKEILKTIKLGLEELADDNKISNDVLKIFEKNYTEEEAGQLLKRVLAYPDMVTKASQTSSMTLLNQMIDSNVDKALKSKLDGEMGYLQPDLTAESDMDRLAEYMIRKNPGNEENIKKQFAGYKANMIEDGMFTDDAMGVSLGKDIIEKYNLQPGDKVFLKVTPIDDEHSFVPVIVTGMTSGTNTMSMNTKYLTEVLGKDYDIDSAHIAVPPTSKHNSHIPVENWNYVHDYLSAVGINEGRLKKKTNEMQDLKHIRNGDLTEFNVQTGIPYKNTHFNPFLSGYAKNIITTLQGQGKALDDRNFVMDKVNYGDLKRIDHSPESYAMGSIFVQDPVDATTVTPYDRADALNRFIEQTFEINDENGYNGYKAKFKEENGYVNSRSEKAKKLGLHSALQNLEALKSRETNKFMLNTEDTYLDIVKNYGYQMPLHDGGNVKDIIDKATRHSFDMQMATFMTKNTKSPFRLTELFGHIKKDPALQRPVIKVIHKALQQARVKGTYPNSTRAKGIDNPKLQYNYFSNKSIQFHVDENGFMYMQEFRPGEGQNVNTPRYLWNKPISDKEYMTDVFGADGSYNSKIVPIDKWIDAMEYDPNDRGKHNKNNELEVKANTAHARGPFNRYHDISPKALGRDNFMQYVADVIDAKVDGFIQVTGFPKNFPVEVTGKSPETLKMIAKGILAGNLNIYEVTPKMLSERIEKLFTNESNPKLLAESASKTANMLTANYNLNNVDAKIFNPVTVMKMSKALDLDSNTPDASAFTIDNGKSITYEPDNKNADGTVKHPEFPVHNLSNKNKELSKIKSFDKFIDNAILKTGLGKYFNDDEMVLTDEVWGKISDEIMNRFEIEGIDDYKPGLLEEIKKTHGKESFKALMELRKGKDLDAIEAPRMAATELLHSAYKTVKEARKDYKHKISNRRNWDFTKSLRPESIIREGSTEKQSYDAGHVIGYIRDITYSNKETENNNREITNTKPYTLNDEIDDVLMTNIGSHYLPRSIVEEILPMQTLSVMKDAIAMRDKYFKAEEMTISEGEVKALRTTSDDVIQAIDNMTRVESSIAERMIQNSKIYVNGIAYNFDKKGFEQLTKVIAKEILALEDRSGDLTNDPDLAIEMQDRGELMANTQRVVSGILKRKVQLQENALLYKSMGMFIGSVNPNNPALNNISNRIIKEANKELNRSLLEVKRKSRTIDLSYDKKLDLAKDVVNNYKKILDDKKELYNYWRQGQDNYAGLSFWRKYQYENAGVEAKKDYYPFLAFGIAKDLYNPKENTVNKDAFDEALLPMYRDIQEQQAAIENANPDSKELRELGNFQEFSDWMYEQAMIGLEYSNQSLMFYKFAQDHNIDGFEKEFWSLDKVEMFAKAREAENIIYGIINKVENEFAREKDIMDLQETNDNVMKRNIAYMEKANSVTLDDVIDHFHNTKEYDIRIDEEVPFMQKDIEHSLIDVSGVMNEQYMQRNGGKDPEVTRDAILGTINAITGSDTMFKDTVDPKDLKSIQGNDFSDAGQIVQMTASNNSGDLKVLKGVMLGVVQREVNTTKETKTEAAYTDNNYRAMAREGRGKGKRAYTGIVENADPEVTTTKKPFVALWNTKEERLMLVDVDKINGMTTGNMKNRSVEKRVKQYMEANGEAVMADHRLQLDKIEKVLQRQKGKKHGYQTFEWMSLKPEHIDPDVVPVTELDNATLEVYDEYGYTKKNASKDQMQKDLKTNLKDALEERPIETAWDNAKAFMNKTVATMKYLGGGNMLMGAGEIAIGLATGSIGHMAVGAGEMLIGKFRPLIIANQNAIGIVANAWKRPYLAMKEEVGESKIGLTKDFKDKLKYFATLKPLTLSINEMASAFNSTFSKNKMIEKEILGLEANTIATDMMSNAGMTLSKKAKLKRLKKEYEVIDFLIGLEKENGIDFEGDMLASDAKDNNKIKKLKNMANDLIKEGVIVHENTENPLTGEKMQFFTVNGKKLSLANMQKITTFDLLTSLWIDGGKLQASELSSLQRAYGYSEKQARTIFSEIYKQAGDIAPSVLFNWSKKNMQKSIGAYDRTPKQREALNSIYNMFARFSRENVMDQTRYLAHRHDVYKGVKKLLGKNEKVFSDYGINLGNAFLSNTGMEIRQAIGFGAFQVALKAGIHYVMPALLAGITELFDLSEEDAEKLVDGKGGASKSLRDIDKIMRGMAINPVLGNAASGIMAVSAPFIMALNENDKDINYNSFKGYMNRVNYYGGDLTPGTGFGNSVIFDAILMNSVILANDALTDSKKFEKYLDEEYTKNNLKLMDAFITPIPYKLETYRQSQKKDKKKSSNKTSLTDY